MIAKNGECMQAEKLVYTDIFVHGLLFILPDNLEIESRMKERAGST